jgi:cytochrome c-type biogenesis protein CcmH/NrfG
MLIGVGVLAFVFVAVSAWFWRARRLRPKKWLGAFALVGWVVGVGIKVHLDQRADTRVAAAVEALPTIAWPSASLGQGTGRADSPPTMAQLSDDESGAVQAAPVSSLVGGLEKRLAAQPDDVRGWALLAQSYAFIGDAAAADRAVRKAVALGTDEQELRSRVDAAMRGPHPN